MDLKNKFRLLHFLISVFVRPFCILLKLLDSGLEAYRYPPEESDDTPYPPIQITLQLSDNVIYCEEPVIARWDPAGTNLR